MMNKNQPGGGVGMQVYVRLDAGGKAPLRLY